MFRKDLIPLLLDTPRTLLDLARLVGAPLREVEDDLQHLLKSLERSEHVAVVTPARCRKCGFIFDERKLKKPGRCPECRQTWIEAPRIHLAKTHAVPGERPE